MFEIGNSLREARVRQQLELGEVELATKIRAPLPAGARGGELRRAPGPDLRQGLPAHLCGLPRARRPALRRRVQLALRRRRRRAARAGRRAADLERLEAAPAASSGAGSRSRWPGSRRSSSSSSPPGSPAATRNEQIPNLGTTTTTQTKKVLPPATPTKHAATKPVSFRLYVRALNGELLDGGAQLVGRAARAASPARSSPASRSASSRAGSGSTSATRGTWRWSTTATSST